MLGALSDFPEYQYTDHVHDFEVKDVSRPHRPAHAVMCYSAGTLFKVIIVGGEVGNALNLCRGLGAQRKTMQGPALYPLDRIALSSRGVSYQSSRDTACLPATSKRDRLARVRAFCARWLRCMTTRVHKVPLDMAGEFFSPYGYDEA